MSFVIGESDYFGFGFRILNCKLLLLSVYPVQSPYSSSPSLIRFGEIKQKLAHARPYQPSVGKITCGKVLIQVS